MQKSEWVPEGLVKDNSDYLANRWSQTSSVRSQDTDYVAACVRAVLMLEGMIIIDPLYSTGYVYRTFC